MNLLHYSNFASRSLMRLFTVVPVGGSQHDIGYPLSPAFKKIYELVLIYSKRTNCLQQNG